MDWRLQCRGVAIALGALCALNCARAHVPPPTQRPTAGSAAHAPVRAAPAGTVRRVLSNESESIVVELTPSGAADDLASYRVRIRDASDGGSAWPIAQLFTGARGFAIAQNEEARPSDVIAWLTSRNAPLRTSVTLTEKGPLTCVDVPWRPHPPCAHGSYACPETVSFCVSEQAGLVRATQHYVHGSRSFAAQGYADSWHARCLLTHTGAMLRGEIVEITAERGEVSLACAPHGSIRFATAADLFRVATAAGGSTAFGADTSVRLEPGKLRWNAQTLFTLEPWLEALREDSKPELTQSARLGFAVKKLSFVGSVFSYSVMATERVEGSPAHLDEAWTAIDVTTGKPANVLDFVPERELVNWLLATEVGEIARDVRKGANLADLEAALAGLDFGTEPALRHRFAFAAYDPSTTRVTLRFGLRQAHFANFMVRPVEITLRAKPAARPALEQAVRSGELTAP